MSMSCYGLYGQNDECQFCVVKMCCQADTRKRFLRWKNAKPKPEVNKLEYELELDEKARKRWFMRRKVEEVRLNAIYREAYGK